MNLVQQLYNEVDKEKNSLAEKQNKRIDDFVLSIKQSIKEAISENRTYLLVHNLASFKELYTEIDASIIANRLITFGLTLKQTPGSHGSSWSVNWQAPGTLTYRTFPPMLPDSMDRYQCNR